MSESPPHVPGCSEGLSPAHHSWRTTYFVTPLSAAPPARSDVWALGATLFHLMYGEPPFQRAMNAAGGSLALAALK